MQIAGKLFKSVGRLSSNLPAFRGRTRLFLVLYEALGLKGKKLHVQALLRKPTPYNARLNLGSWLQRVAFLTGGYEEDTVQFLRRLHETSPRPGYLLDVGANVGLISIPFALLEPRLQPNAGPIAVTIEAVPDNVRALRQNIQSNNLDASIDVIDIAVGECEKEVDIQVEENHAEGEGSGTANILPDGSDYKCVRQKVRVTTIDSLRRANRIPDGCSVIKIDTDGYDLKVLQGAVSFLKSNRPVIFGEFAAHCLGWHGQSLGDVIGFASDCRYVTWQRRAGTLQFSDITSEEFAQDLLLVPEELTSSFQWCLVGASN